MQTASPYFFMNITLDGVKFDLRKLGFHFDLNDDQVSALNQLAEFCNGEERAITLQGSAGTGKTTIIKIFMEYYREAFDGWCTLVAPTHKAKGVLNRLTSSDDAQTLHSLLGLKPNIDVLEFDAREIEFLMGDGGGLNVYNSVLIIDESSMINNDLYELLILKAKMWSSKIVFIGDSAQLQPVKQGELSKVFNLPNKIVLDKVERQGKDNPLLDCLVSLREEPITKFESSPDGRGIQVFEDAREFLLTLRKEMTAKRLEDDPYHSRILTFTNKRVEKYNQVIRKLLKYDDEYVVGDLLMAYDNYKMSKKEILTNSMDYVVKDASRIGVVLPNCNILVDGYQMVVKDIIANQYRNFYVLSRDMPRETYDRIARELETYRSRAVALKNKPGASAYWRKFFVLNESFATPIDLMYDGRAIKKKTIDYGYAHTVHKSQGATYQEVFVDNADIQLCPTPAGIRQLQYVALSRARQKAFILQ